LLYAILLFFCFFGDPGILVCHNTNYLGGGVSY
jgi:hypothetical protein